jgi:hypothetical protein
MSVKKRKNIFHFPFQFWPAGGIYTVEGQIKRVHNRMRAVQKDKV